MRRRNREADRAKSQRLSATDFLIDLSKKINQLRKFS